jgi:hypothetical protein
MRHFGLRIVHLHGLAPVPRLPNIALSFYCRCYNQQQLLSAEPLYEGGDSRADGYPSFEVRSMKRDPILPDDTGWETAFGAARS